MDGKKAADKLIEALQLEENEYRVGTTKVSYFKTCESRRRSHSHLESKRQ
jgi:hypothetical protein